MSEDKLQEEVNEKQNMAENAEETVVQTETGNPETEGSEAETSGEDTKETEAAPDPRDAKIEDLQNRLLRLQADFDNFRRRNTSEREQLSTFVTIDVVGKFLKVLDNFERAEAAAVKATEVQGIITGMENIRRQFEQCLTDLGVKEIPAQNVKFDPNVHEAVMRGQNPEVEDDTIDAVFEKGYQLHDKVIRHSKVRVISNE